MGCLKTQRWIPDQKLTVLLDILTRVVLIAIFMYLEQATPFIRIIHYEELWLYKYPHTEEYVPAKLLWLLCLLLPMLLLLLHFFIRRNKAELYQAVMALTLALVLTGIVTDTIKLIVGRPRPDFLSRCFPDGKIKWPSTDPVSGLSQGSSDLSTACMGDHATIQSGRKSFPSGHSSLAFCSLSFVSLWLCRRLSVLGEGRGQGWRLVLAGAPLLGAGIIALSRTCDYHHHWQDVLVGSALGFIIAFICYQQYFPCLCCNEPLHCNHCRCNQTVATLYNGTTGLPLRYSPKSSRDASPHSSRSSRIPSPGAGGSSKAGYSFLPS